MVWNMLGFESSTTKAWADFHFLLAKTFSEHLSRDQIEFWSTRAVTTVLTIGKINRMRKPALWIVTEMVSCKLPAGQSTFKHNTKGKSGAIQDGLLKMVKVVYKNGEDVSEL